MRKIKRDLPDSYKWVVFAAGFLMVFVCLGFCSSPKGLYLSAITEALGLKRSLFSINDSCRYITTAIASLFFGSLIARFGPRKMIAAGFLALIASMLLYSVATSIYVFYLGGALLGLGLSWTTTAVVGYLVNSWSSENRGRIMGVILCANGLGGALSTQIVSPIIYEEGNPFGYKNAYLLTVAVLAVTAVIVVLLVREKPGTVVKTEQKKPKHPTFAGLPLEELYRKPYFYVIAVCICFTGMTLQSVSGVASAHMRDIGVNVELIAVEASIHSLSLAAAKFLTGFSFDKFGLRVTMILCQICAIVMILMLALMQVGPYIEPVAIVYGVLSSFALPLETIMLPLITSGLFGERNYAKLLGIVIAVNTVGFAIGSPLMNLVYDLVGSYRPIMLHLGGVMIMVAVVFQICISLSRRDLEKT